MTETPLFFICLTDIPGVRLALTESLCKIYKAGIGDSGGLIAGRPKGVRTPPRTPKKKGVRGLHAFPTRRANPRMPHAVCTPTNGVRTAGLACGPAGQACTAGTPVQPGSRKPLESRGLRYRTVPFTVWYPYKGTKRYPYKGIPGVRLALTESLCKIYKAGIGDSGGLIAGRPKGVRTPPRTPKKKGVRGLHAFPTRRANPRMPHAVCTPTNGVRTAGLACGPAGQACTAGTPVRPGSREWYPYKGTKRYPYKGTVWYPYKGTTRYPHKGTVRYPYKGTTRYPYKGTKRYPYKGTTWYPYKGTKRYPYKGTTWYPYKGTKRYPYKGTTWYPYKGTKRYPYKGTTRYPYKGTTRYPYKGTMCGGRARPARPPDRRAWPARLSGGAARRAGRPHAICRRADGVRHAGVCTPVWKGVQPPHAFFLGVRGGVRMPFGRAAIKPRYSGLMM
ncbi:hypothetical protein PCASD_24044 [Puccinia coronata f. sp. avenae]|uniref:Uncharacterized protein n=1 Tax=Puccinia coronata f. sp. avenae TaxID=200324 RepID=A0A2N5TRT2_9BASI|nr:hypothetical protein PCASD_24044 [Puccinia coronata f. sp. avenae]